MRVYNTNRIGEMKADVFWEKLMNSMIKITDWNIDVIKSSRMYGAKRWKFLMPWMNSAPVASIMVLLLIIEYATVRK